jgi:hypothetical protein
MTKRSDQLGRIEAALTRVEEALASQAAKAAEGRTRVEGLGGTLADLAEVVQHVMAARGEHDGQVIAEAKAARLASESVFAAAQSLAAVTTEHTRAVREVSEAVAGIPVPPAAEATEVKAAAKGKTART